MGKEHRRSRREDEDYISKDRERSRTGDSLIEKDRDDKERRISSRDRRDDVEEREKEKRKDVRDKDYDRHRDRDRERERDHKERGRDKDREKEREVEKDHYERGREKKEKDRHREKERDRPKDREREKHKERERGKGRDKDWDRSEKERGKGKDRERDMEVDINDKPRIDQHNQGDSSPEHGQIVEHVSGEQKISTSEIRQRMLKMKEERLKGESEALAWVNKSRKQESKMISEKKKALHLSKVFEEQDNAGQEESDEEDRVQLTSEHLAGMKVLHGLDKVLEGGAVVLTLKDQNILADGDINNEIDMLINVEIGEQKQREEAYKLAKKKTGIYDDKFNNDPDAQKKMLPQYDEPIGDEGITLDKSGRFTDEAAEKKLQELRTRIQGLPASRQLEDLNSSRKVTSDYYSQAEMLQFKKPKKKKSLRKKDKLDLDALEAEAISSGLGAGDLGSRSDPKRQIAKDIKERSEAQMRKDAYQTAYSKAEEASKALWREPTSDFKEEDENYVYGEDEDLQISLEKARKLALRKQGQSVATGPELVASLTITSTNESANSESNPSSEVTQENRVVFTEMEEFVYGLQLDEESHKPTEDVFMEEVVERVSPDPEMKTEVDGVSEILDASTVDNLGKDEKNNVAIDDITHEVPVGKGLANALKLIKERGTLNETTDWGGRNMDKKKSKLVGINDGDATKEIQIDRRDEFGRIMTPKEAFRTISHKFHGKEPGKMKQEKRLKQFKEEQRLKNMNKSDTPSQSMEKMRQTQEQMKLPYLVLSGNVRPGQDSDPRSGFATVENLPGGLTPMLGDRKVELFLGLKRKADTSMGLPKVRKKE